MNIVLTTDHTGIEKLKLLESYLVHLGHTCTNVGPETYDAYDDYPDLIYPAARGLAKGQYDCGVIMGGSGQGEAIVANRVKGVRCAVYYGPAPIPEAIDVEGHSAEDAFEIIRLSRQHNNANMLSLAARFLSQSDIESAVKLWLDTPFSNLERHQRRIVKIDELAD
jgi:ribose 5-phosphate isomerase B